MAGLLAWAADVVGAGGAQSNEEDDPNSIPIVFTAEQQKYVQELDQKAASLGRVIQDLRLRLPPPDISQRLPHLHAHSLASNAALALQLNAHSATREQDGAGKSEAGLVASQSDDSSDSVVQSKMVAEGGADAEVSRSAILEKLENRKKNWFSSVEEIVQDLEKSWAYVQDRALKQPSPAQREKYWNKQLHSLIDNWQQNRSAQAESLIDGLWRRVESDNIEVNTARNRYGRSASERGSSSSDYVADQKLMLLRSTFVLYIFALHILSLSRFLFEGTKTS
ncbi:hypothetical protein I3760_Q005800 [Carya illinoinensis]|nr:hypothetical protein I3760_Q005800 [Carya illinoinensis]